MSAILTPTLHRPALTNGIVGLYWHMSLSWQAERSQRLAETLPVGMVAIVTRQRIEDVIEQAREGGL